MFSVLKSRVEYSGSCLEFFSLNRHHSKKKTYDSEKNKTFLAYLPLTVQPKFQLSMSKTLGWSEHEFTQTHTNTLWLHFRYETIFSWIFPQRQTMLRKKQKVKENAMIEVQVPCFPNFWELGKLVFSGVFSLCVLRSGLVPRTNIARTGILWRH